jgi:hypothetical protein
MPTLQINFPKLDLGMQCDSNNYKKYATELDTNADMHHLQAGKLNNKNYYLPHGKEGQLVYFTADLGDNCDNICIWVSTYREYLSTKIKINGCWYPFRTKSERMIAVAIFVNGAWNFDSATGP